ncbi:MAG: DUF6544 family protein [Anaerolineales bacterium]
MNSISIVLLLLLVLVVISALGWLASGTRRSYRSEVNHYLSASEPIRTVVEEPELKSLPAPVRRYLLRVGVVGQPQARNLRAVWTGRMRRGPESPWFPIWAEQHNFYGPLVRTFFIRGRMLGIPVIGRDLYAEGQGEMVMRPLGLVPVVDLKGEELAASGLVTIFNDMCLLSPSTLLDSRVSWEPLDDQSARASLTDHGRTVAATLSFNEDGDLAEFTTEDRFMESEGGFVRVPWSTPVSQYRQIGDQRVPTYGKGVWHLADGVFEYAEFHLQSLAINVTDAG